LKILFFLFFMSEYSSLTYYLNVNKMQLIIILFVVEDSTLLNMIRRLLCWTWFLKMPVYCSKLFLFLSYPLLEYFRMNIFPWRNLCAAVNRREILWPENNENKLVGCNNFLVKVEHIPESSYLGCCLRL